MSITFDRNSAVDVQALNEDINKFPQVHPITEDMIITHKGVSQLVMLDRYAFKDTEKKTLKEGDFVVLTVKPDPNFPARGFGTITTIDWDNNEAQIQVAEEFTNVLEDESEVATGVIKRNLSAIDKPLEIYYEQIALRNTTGLAAIESTEETRTHYQDLFNEELKNLRFVPAGRVLYGAGSETDVTYFNCYVMPYVKDSREGISDHRKQVMEIMSRGGGVGTNGSTLRPRNTLARGVNGKSSGSVSWLDDIAKLTHLVEQGGSRRGAQMIMLADWHPDILEFIISKMQNPRILRYLIENTADEQIEQLATEKLHFTPLTETEKDLYQGIVNYYNMPGLGGFTKEAIKEAENKLRTGGTYAVNNSEFLTGANISVCLTKEFMEAVENDADYALRFPDVENYSSEEMHCYNETWHELGDVRTWEEEGHQVCTYRTIKAKELWNLINICATYSAEPGIFFIDNANEKTNAKSYGQQVVATNPCFHPDTRVSTEFGLLTIEALHKKMGHKRFQVATDNRLHQSIQVVNGGSYEIPGITMRSGKVFPTGIRQTLTIHLKNGQELQVTPEHRIYTGQGWKEAKDLQLEDIIYIQSGSGMFARTDAIGQDMALFLGCLTGDGWLAKDGRAGIAFDEDDTEMIPEILDAGQKVSGLRSKVYEREDGAFQIFYHKTNFTDILENHGVKRCKTPEKRVPHIIFESSRDEVITFMRALFSVGGTVYTADSAHRTVTLTSSSKKMLQDVQLLLLNVGVHAKVYNRHKRNQAEFSYVSMDGEQCVYNSFPSYELIISDDNLSVFKEVIGFKYITKKEEALSQVPTFSNKREEFTSIVVGISEGEEVAVYDITEPETNSLIANGMVAHNCGEQPLAPYSVCNLAAINLAEMANKTAKTVNFDQLRETVQIGVRMQDNVIDATPYFLEANKKQALGERRVGLGVMGLHDLLIYCETVYGSEEGNELVDKIFETIAVTAYRTSIEIAKEKGSFPFLVGETEEGTRQLREAFINTGYMKGMPLDIKEGIIRYGIRNSHLLTVAPTGSTGTMVGVSTGLEPYFSFSYYRSGRLGKFIEVKAAIVEEYLQAHPEKRNEELPDWFVTAMTLSPEAHADTQCVIQRWIDSSISKTVNAPKGYSVSQVESVYERLYRGGAKGGTVYVDGSRDSQVLTLKEETSADEQLSFDEELYEDEEEQPKVVIMDTIRELEHTNVTIGSEVGDCCPVCREGHVAEIGGCNTCTSCGAQLKCGL